MSINLQLREDLYRQQEQQQQQQRRAASQDNSVVQDPNAVAQAVRLSRVGGLLDNAKRQLIPADKRVAVMVYATVLCTIAAWVLLRPWEVTDWPAIASLAVLTMAMQWMSIDLSGRGRIFLGAVLVLAAGMQFGPPAALLIAPLVPLTLWILRGGLVHTIALDLGSVSLSGVLAALACNALIPIVPSVGNVHLVPGLAAGIVYYVVNIGILTVAQAFGEDQDIPKVWAASFKWLIPYYVAFGILAACLAAACVALGLLGLFVFCLPPLLIHYAMKTYLDRAQQTIVELRKSKQELQDTTDQTAHTLSLLRETHEGTVKALSAILDSSDTVAAGHSQRVADYAVAIAKELGVSEDDIAIISVAALLHDVGKIGLPDAILRTGSLSTEEWALLKTHPERAGQMLRHIPPLAKPLTLVLNHHEHFDGKGYPNGTSGDDIPIGARVIAVADALETLTSEYPGRPTRPFDGAVTEIMKSAGTQFDPWVVRALLRLDGERLGFRGTSRKSSAA